VKDVTPHQEQNLDHYSFPAAEKFNLKIRATKIVGLDPGVTKEQQRSDPYFRIKAISYNEKTFREIVLTDNIKNVREGEWDIKLNVHDCGGIDSPLIFESWDWDKGKEHDFIGQSIFTLRLLKMMQEKNKGVPLYLKKSNKDGGKQKRRAILWVKEFNIDNSVKQVRLPDINIKDIDFVNLPPGFDPAPPKPAARKGMSEDEYKEYMRNKLAYESWENKLLLFYRKKAAEEQKNKVN